MAEGLFIRGMLSNRVLYTLYNVVVEMEYNANQITASGFHVHLLPHKYVTNGQFNPVRCSLIIASKGTKVNFG